MTNIHIYADGQDFSVLMYDDGAWDGHGHILRFNCSRSELQAGIEKGLSLFAGK